jgi:hypothetical protein
MQKSSKRPSKPIPNAKEMRTELDLLKQQLGEYQKEVK